MTDQLRLASLIAEGYAKKPPMEWPQYEGGFTDRSMYVTASEVGGCERRVKFGKLLPKAKRGAWGFFERGHNVEAWAVNLIREALKGDNLDLMYGGEDQRSFVNGDQSATPDGMLVDSSDEDEVYVVGVEIKSIDPRTNKKNLPKSEHIAQVQQAMDVVSSSTHMDVGATLLVYINASNYMEMTEFVIEADADHQARLRKKAARIMDTDPDELKPEGVFMPKQCDYCDYTNECSLLEHEKATSELDVAGLSEMERVTNEILKRPAADG